jgi:hypothetical protein
METLTDLDASYILHVRYLRRLRPRPGNGLRVRPDHDGRQGGSAARIEGRQGLRNGR